MGNRNNKKRSRLISSFYPKLTLSKLSLTSPFPSGEASGDEGSCLGGCCCLLIFFAWLAFMLSTTRVDAGHVGIKKRFGAVADEALAEGLNIIAPFIDSVYHMDTRI